MPAPTPTEYSVPLATLTADPDTEGGPGSDGGSHCKASRENHGLENPQQCSASVLGTPKAISTFLGETSTPNNLDWTTGVVWTLISYWVSLIEQENAFSKYVRRGIIGLLLVLAVALFWSGIYGVIALGCGLSIRPPVLHGVVGMTELGVLIFMHWQQQNWQHTTFDDLFLLVVLRLRPIGITLMVTTRGWYDIEKDSEIANVVAIGVGVAWGMAQTLVVDKYEENRLVTILPTRSFMVLWAVARICQSLTGASTIVG
ncbi:hypothetical protein DFH09DRAFT_1283142 [Mycena vulgaris]|nr:hypothetical protein DFH09DRAFT_1283142 [Mycena vulgaris]